MTSRPHEPDPSPFTDHNLQDALAGLLNDDPAALAAYLPQPIDDDQFVDVEHALTYSDAGVLTYNAGLVLRMTDGAEFQITIVRSA